MNGEFLRSLTVWLLLLVVPWLLIAAVVAGLSLLVAVTGGGAW